MFLSKLGYSELVLRLFEKMTFFLADPRTKLTMMVMARWATGDDEEDKDNDGAMTTMTTTTTTTKTMTTTTTRTTTTTNRRW